MLFVEIDGRRQRTRCGASQISSAYRRARLCEKKYISRVFLVGLVPASMVKQRLENNSTPLECIMEKDVIRHWFGARA